MQDAGAHESHQGPSLRHPLVAQQNTPSGFVTVNLSDLADLVQRRVSELRADKLRSREGIIVSRVVEADARAESEFIQGTLERPRALDRDAPIAPCRRFELGLHLETRPNGLLREFVRGYGHVRGKGLGPEDERS